jgi:hypothetical protein
VVGVLLGLGSAWLVLSGTVRGPEESVGAWSDDFVRGGEEAGPSGRSFTPVQGLLALAAEEAVYFVATDDSEGSELRGDCTYRVTGDDLPASWWSLTLYDGAYLPQNDDGHLSVDATGVERAADGWWSAYLAPSPEGRANWISTNGADRPNLLLRLYLPDDSVLDDPSTVPVPRITRLTCGGDR